MAENIIDTIAEDFMTQLNLDKIKTQHKIEVCLYFDNSVIRGMIQGIDGIDTGYKVDFDKFRSHLLWVQSLAYSGFIKNIRLLPPHQDELLDFLSKKYLLPVFNKEGAKEAVDNLLYQVGLGDIQKLKQYVETGNIAEYLSTFKHKSVDLFKVNYLLKERNWNKRLQHLISFDDDSIVIIDESFSDLNAALNSDVFKQIVQIFTKEREKKSRNNFRDALSLALISEMVSKRSADASIPLFYASTYVIRKIKEYPELNKQFNIQIKTEKETVVINALRDSYFFILDVMFHLLEDVRLPKEIFEKITLLKEKYNSLSVNDLMSKSRMEKELETVIFQDKFFYDFWFDKITNENLTETIKDIVAFDFFKNDGSLYGLIEKDRGKITKTLSNNLKKLKLLEKIWLALETFIDDKRKLFKPDHNIKVLTDLGLTRFSPCNADEIQNIFETIFFCDDKKDDDFHEIKIRLTNYITNGLYKRNYEELIIAISIFWIFNKHDLIMEILSDLRFDYGDCYQLALYHAASVYPADYKKKEIVSTILEKQDLENAASSNYKIAIGLGFIYYHMWKSKSGKLIIPEEGTKESSMDIIYVHHAIRVTEIAYKWLQEHKDEDESKIDYRNQKFYYSLNNLLYFKVWVEDSSKLKEWEILAIELRHCRSTYKSLYWQYRFDHTLAFYEYRKYVINKQKGKKIENDLETAKKYINESLDGIALYKDDYEFLQQKIISMLQSDFPPNKY